METFKQFSCIALLTLVPIATGILIFVRGLVLHILWGWFVYPVTGQPSPGIALCAGLAVVVNYVAGRSMSKQDIENSWEPPIGFLVVLGKDALALIVGWLLHFFV